MVVVVLTVCINDVFVDIIKRVHPIGVAAHLGVRLPASPPPWASRPAGRRPKNAAKLQQTTPHRRQEADHAQLQLCVPVCVATEMSQFKWFIACNQSSEVPKAAQLPPFVPLARLAP